MATTSPTRPRPPSVDRILSIIGAEGIDVPDREALVPLVRDVLRAERARLATGAAPTDEIDLVDAVLDRIEELADAELTMPPHVINATGVVLHTNLGRAPWPTAARVSASLAARSYGYLELDAATGRRGPRYREAEDHLVALTGAEDALIVTNNAAALAIAVGLAGRRGSIVVSRGELVEIGGGVRIPEVIARAGARLIEVGTTNRTRAADFEAPLADGRARVVLRVHPSNFTVEGFTEAPAAEEVAAIAHRHGAIVVDDLGSGALIDTERFGLAHEPTPSERLDGGSDLVLFSGDKLVGGPQAGLIVGRAELVRRLRSDPFARAMRPDKAILAGIAATLAIYRRGGALSDIPVWQIIAADPAGLEERARWIVSMAQATAPQVAPQVVSLRSPVGGGSLPGQTLPSFGVAVRVRSPMAAAARLRTEPPRILARIVDDALVFDLRTARSTDDGTIANRLGELQPPG